MDLVVFSIFGSSGHIRFSFSWIRSRIWYAQICVDKIIIKKQTIILESQANTIFVGKSSGVGLVARLPHRPCWHERMGRSNATTTRPGQKFKCWNVQMQQQQGQVKCLNVEMSRCSNVQYISSKARSSVQMLKRLNFSFRWWWLNCWSPQMPPSELIPLL